MAGFFEYLRIESFKLLKKLKSNVKKKPEIPRYNYEFIENVYQGL